MTLTKIVVMFAVILVMGKKEHCKNPAAFCISSGHMPVHLNSIFRFGFI